MTTVAGETSAAQGVSETKLDQMLDAGRLGVGARLFDALRIDVDADAAGAVGLRGGDGDPAVPAAEVVDDVVLGRSGQDEHAIHDVFRRRDVGRQALAAAARHWPAGQATRQERGQGRRGTQQSESRIGPQHGSDHTLAVLPRRGVSDRKPFPHMAFNRARTMADADGQAHAHEERQNREKWPFLAGFPLPEAR